MTNSTSINIIWPVAIDAAPVELGVRAPLAGLAMLRDSARILGAFAWGKPARLSHNKSAELCSLMDG